MIYVVRLIFNSNGIKILECGDENKCIDYFCKNTAQNPRQALKHFRLYGFYEDKSLYLIHPQSKICEVYRLRDGRKFSEHLNQEIRNYNIINFLKSN